MLQGFTPSHRADDALIPSAPTGNACTEVKAVADEALHGIGPADLSGTATQLSPSSPRLWPQLCFGPLFTACDLLPQFLCTCLTPAPPLPAPAPAWTTVPSTLPLICPDPSFNHHCNFFKDVLLDPLARCPIKTQVAVTVWLFFQPIPPRERRPSSAALYMILSLSSPHWAERIHLFIRLIPWSVNFLSACLGLFLTQRSGQ